jgi:ATP-dependent RNA helicase RhlE
MILQKLNEQLFGTLEEAKLEQLNALQEKTIARIKQGGDLIAISEAGSGKTWALALSALLKAPDSYEGSPRAIIVCATVDKTRELYEMLKKWVKKTESSIEIAHENASMISQRNNIFDGADILVTTPGRLFDLYIQNGINLNKITFFAVDDAAQVTKDTNVMRKVSRVTESLPKCQRFLFSDILTANIEKLAETALQHPMLLEM